MKKNIWFEVLLILALILTVIRLATHNNITLIITAVLMAVCVVLSLTKKS